MKRRDFITLLGGATAGPVAARAQQRERMRRIGFLMNLAADDPVSQARNAAFLQALQELGRTAGRNLQIEYRWGGEIADRNRECAAELVALAPDVIVAGESSPGLQHCAGRRAQYRSCSRASSTRSAGASSRVWLGRAAMPPDSRSSNTASAGNGWSCSRRSFRG